MRSLTIIGTAAMFMVGGGILTHGLHMIGEQIHHAEQAVAAMSFVGPVLAVLTPSVLNGLFGVVAGAVALAVMTGIQKLRS
jgi:predicted DNA repair protein MutK